MKRESVNEKINDLRKYMFSDVPTIINNDDMTIEKYISTVRVIINTALIEICMGLDMTEKKNGDHIFKYGAKPTLEQISDLSNILDEYVEKIERRFYEEIEIDSDEDDLEIPNESEANTGADANIQCVKQQLFSCDHLSRKTIMNEYCSKVSEGTIKSRHLVELYEVGLKLRRKRMIITASIIAGALVAAGITTAIVVFCGKKKDTADDAYVDDENIIDVTDEVSDDMNTDSESEVTGDEDVPVVNFE